MKSLLKKYKKLSKKIDKNFDKKNKKLNKKLSKCLKKLMSLGKNNKVLKEIDKNSKNLKNYIFNEKQTKILKLNKTSEKKESTNSIDDFWNELAITQICAGSSPSVLTNDMKKSFNGDKKAIKKIKGSIDVSKAAYKGFLYLRSC